MNVALRTVTIAGAMTLVLAGCGGPAPQGGAGVGGGGLRASTKIVAATIFITPGNGGACAATSVPGRIQVKKNEHVEWSMVDFCGITAGYTKEFELKWTTVDGSTCSDGTKFPLDSPSKGKLHIRRGINSTCDDGKVFKYEIWVETTKLADPELEIAM